MGTFINFVEIGEICDMHHWLTRDGRLWVFEILHCWITNWFLVNYYSL